MFDAQPHLAHRSREAGRGFWHEGFGGPSEICLWTQFQSPPQQRLLIDWTTAKAETEPFPGGTRRWLFNHIVNGDIPLRAISGLYCAESPLTQEQQ